MTSEPLIRSVSDTALWTAAYRADESERSDALFRDPFARALAGERGAEIAAKVKPAAVRWAVVLRTAALDDLILDAVRDRGFDVVLDLAAGLDARPYRLDLPGTLAWIEADVPEIVEYKEAVLAPETPRCRVERVAADLVDPDARRGLFAHAAAQGDRVLVVTEGLLQYLEPADVAALSADLAARPGIEEWLTDLTGAGLTDRLKQAGGEIKDASARTRFAPAEGSAFFEPHGWVENGYLSLFDEGPRRGRISVAGRAIRIAMRFMPAEKRRMFERGVGIVSLGRARA
jgi:methyltransferase (TIGR00027 family)